MSDRCLVHSDGGGEIPTVGGSVAGSSHDRSAHTRNSIGQGSVSLLSRPGDGLLGLLESRLHETGTMKVAFHSASSTAHDASRLPLYLGDARPEWRFREVTVNTATPAQPASCDQLRKQSVDTRKSAHCGVRDGQRPLAQRVPRRGWHGRVNACRRRGAPAAGA